MCVTLENHALKVSIHKKGAELFSVFNKKTALEYMWSGDPAFWSKTSPVLFPIVGALKDGSYSFKDKNYAMSRHGFARDRTFELESQTIDTATFLLESSLETLAFYPFSFSLRIIYQISDYTVTVTYEVINEGAMPMHFSLGAHPAFKIPLTEGTNYEDYFLEFNSTESAQCWKISPEGLMMNESYSLLHNTTRLALKKEMFHNDALVFKNMKSDCISLKSTKHNHGLDFFFAGFPYFGLWAAKDADFICLEPWCGIADAVYHDKQLENKEGMQKISRGQKWSRNWSIKSY